MRWKKRSKNLQLVINKKSREVSVGRAVLSVEKPQRKSSLLSKAKAKRRLSRKIWKIWTSPLFHRVPESKLKMYQTSRRYLWCRQTLNLWQRWLICIMMWSSRFLKRLHPLDNRLTWSKTLESSPRQLTASKHALRQIITWVTIAMLHRIMLPLIIELLKKKGDRAYWHRQLTIWRQRVSHHSSLLRKTQMRKGKRLKRKWRKKEASHH
jgi:hypothetical protein